MYFTSKNYKKPLIKVNYFLLLKVRQSWCQNIQNFMLTSDSKESFRKIYKKR